MNHHTWGIVVLEMKLSIIQVNIPVINMSVDEYHRTSDVHGSTADSRSGHDKYENHYQHSYVQRISGDRHHDESSSSE